MIVREALVAHPRVLAPSTPAREAAELLRTPGVRSVLVVSDDQLVGCVTAATIVAAVAEGRDVRSLAVGDLCEDDVTTIGPDAPLDVAIRLMGERELERLAVVESGRFLGVLPREPVVRRIAEDEPPPPDDDEI
jgi:predicted transcriptional regulator